YQLRQALAGPAGGEAPSSRVVAAVMAEVRRDAAERPARSARLFDLLAGLLAAGTLLAWAVVRLGLAIWPGLAAVLRVPAQSVAGAVVWWILVKAGTTLLGLLTSGVGNLLPLAVLGFLVLTPLTLRLAGRSAS
ncbi:MAG: hypothetical protein ACM3UP_02345, partial [Methanocella sp.]